MKFSIVCLTVLIASEYIPRLTGKKLLPVHFSSMQTLLRGTFMKILLTKTRFSDHTVANISEQRSNPRNVSKCKNLDQYSGFIIKNTEGDTFLSKKGLNFISFICTSQNVKMLFRSIFLPIRVKVKGSEIKSNMFIFPDYVFYNIFVNSSQ